MSTKRRTLLIFGLALVILLVLAAGLSSLVLKPGQNFDIQNLNKEPGASWLPVNIDIVQVIFQAFMALILILLPFFIIYMLIDPRRRKQLLVDLLGIGFMLMLLYFFRQSLGNKAQNQTVPLAPPAGNPNLYPAPVGTPAVFSPPPADNLVTIVAILLGGLAVASAVVAWYFIARSRRAQPSAVQLLAAQADETIEDLLSGKNLRDTILLCYRRMTEIAARNRNIPREASDTPHEFEQAMIAKGLPAVPVRDLTRIFEDIRYGDQNAGEEERRRAVSALRIIAAVCRTPETSA